MGLRMRGETVEELAGFASAMRERVVRVEAPAGTIDVVGTGGDGSGTFNISTTAALIVASLRRAGGEARQPGDHVEVGLGGRARRPRRPDRPRRGLGRAGDARARLRVPVRAGLPPGHAPRGPDAPGDRRADRVQPPRAAHQPRRRDPRADRGGRRGRRARGSPRCCGCSGTERTLRGPRRRASTSCRSTARRDLRRDARRDRAARRSTPRRWVWARRRRRR